MPANKTPPPGLSADERALYEYTANAGPHSAYGACQTHFREQPQIWAQLSRRKRDRLPKTEEEARERLEALVVRGVLRHVRCCQHKIHYGVPGTYHPDDEVNQQPQPREHEHPIGAASLSAALARAPGDVLLAQARAEWSRLCSFRAHERVRHEDGWNLVQYALEWRDDEIVHGFGLECWRTDEECDEGDQIFGYVDNENVVPEQWS